MDATELALMWNPLGGAGQLPFQDGITDVGQGDIDFRRFLGALGDADDHHYIWERDTANDAPKGEFTSARDAPRRAGATDRLSQRLPAASRRKAAAKTTAIDGLTLVGPPVRTGPSSPWRSRGRLIVR